MFFHGEANMGENVHENVDINKYSSNKAAIDPPEHTPSNIGGKSDYTCLQCGNELNEIIQTGDYFGTLASCGKCGFINFPDMVK